jgi:hypothetical protein
MLFFLSFAVCVIGCFAGSSFTVLNHENIRSELHAHLRNHFLSEATIGMI